jgi:hypothetical protein
MPSPPPLLPSATGTSSSPSDEQGAAMLEASVAEYDVADARLL